MKKIKIKTFYRRRWCCVLLLLVYLCKIQCFAYDVKIEELYYNVYAATNTATVAKPPVYNTSMKAMYTGDITIPETIEYNGRTLTVTGLETGAFSESEITSIEFPNSLSNIGVETFENCKTLKNVKLPSELEKIGGRVFYGCVSLEEINLPSCLISIGSEVFSDCINLQGINLPSSLTYIGSGAFQRSGISKIIIPDGIVKIPEKCFLDCKNLEEILLPNSLTSIASAAFQNCTVLKTLHIPNSVTDIDIDIIWGCDSLENLVIGTGLTELPTYYTGYYSSSGPTYDYYIGRCIQSNIYYYSGFKPNSNDHILHSTDIDELYLGNLKNITIDDSDEEFIIGCSFGDWDGFKLIKRPLFYNCHLDNFYVGRPISGIWHYNRYSNSYEKSEGSEGPEPISSTSKQCVIDTLEVNGYCKEVPGFCYKVYNIILGNSVEKWANSVITGNLRSIICYRNFPPELTASFSNSEYLNCIVYVPKGCKEIYANTSGWNNFWNIEELELTAEELGIKKVSRDIISWKRNSDGSISFANFENTGISIYDSSGKLILNTEESTIRNLPKGIYIIVTDTGKSYKVVI